MGFWATTERKGCDTGIFHCWHGVESFDSLSYVQKLGKPHEVHMAESLHTDPAAGLGG